jgi:hypothetical protein
MALSFADLVFAVRQMVTALSANQEQVAARGLTPEFVAEGRSLVEQVEALNTKQEHLKAELKTTTTELEAALQKLRGWHTESVSVVKLTYNRQPTKWLEFGIKAKK